MALRAAQAHASSQRRFEDDKSLQQLESELLQIQPNPATTSYNVKTVAACNPRN